MPNKSLEYKVNIMFHEDILYIFYCKYTKTYFLLVICIAKNFI